MKRLAHALALLSLTTLALRAETTNAVVEIITQQEVNEAALYGKSEVVANALKQGYDANQADVDQRTALMFAAYSGQAEIIEKLLAGGATVDACDTTGSTALMFAASGPSTESVVALLDAGAEIDRVDSNEHFTALMWAAAEGQLENVELLISKGADLTLTDIDGDTAESFAEKSGHAAVVDALKNAAKKSAEASAE